MSEGGDHFWNVVAGGFLFLFGLCLLLAGGACSALWIAELRGGGSDGLFLIIISFGTVLLGLWVIYHGIRLMIPRRRG